MNIGLKKSYKLDKMKNGITSEKYYFLLEWKDANMEEYLAMKGDKSLCDLTTYELNKLYEAVK